MSDLVAVLSPDGEPFEVHPVKAGLLVTTKGWAYAKAREIADGIADWRTYEIGELHAYAASIGAVLDKTLGRVKLIKEIEKLITVNNQRAADAAFAAVAAAIEPPAPVVNNDSPIPEVVAPSKA